MLDVDEIVEAILDREGGFVDDPDDPGGATNHGVTIHTMRRLGLDLNRDGSVDEQDVRQLSRSKAKQIFLDQYFRKPRIDRLPEALQASVFDMQVNAGSNAIRLLQKLLDKMGFDVAVDGILGPQTAKTAARAMQKAPDHFVDAYGIERRNYYYALADRRPASRKYAKSRDGGKGGWIKRAEEFISAKYHYSLKDHQQRTKHWA